MEKMYYEMLRKYVNAYDAVEFPDNILDADISVIDRINKKIDSLKVDIVTWAVMYIHEMEGEKK